jgi:hypothetical protein
MFQEGLFSYLTTQSSVTALLGTKLTRGDATAGVFPLLAISDATMPYIVFQQVSGEPVWNLTGANKLQFARYRLSFCATSYKAAVVLAEKVKLLFATYGGTFPDGTVVQAASQLLEADDLEVTMHGTVYTRHIDFEFIFVDNDGA